MAKKTRIRFNAEPQHLLVIDAKTSVGGGKEVDVDEEIAADLVSCGYADVTIVDGSTPEPRWPRDHAGMDALAEKLSLRWPNPAEGKTTITVTEKQAALEEAGFTPESALEEPADGDPNDNKEGAE